MIDSHKTKTSTLITRIISVVSMWDITSLCINICAVISAITSDKRFKPILRQVLTTISQLTTNQDWAKWMETCGTAMPHLHFHFYLFIDRIWALLSGGATEFNNINAFTGNCPIRDLNLAHHLKAIQVLRALINQVSLAQYQGAPILVQASNIRKNSLKFVPSNMTFHNNSTTNSNQLACCDAKRDPAIHEGGKSRDTNKQPQKKGKTTVAKPCKIAKKEMGLFYLRNPNASALNVLPMDLAEKFFVDFFCKGKECIRDNCTHLPPCLANNLNLQTVEAIGHSFAATKKGWLSEYHFRRVTLPANVTAMLGGSDGPFITKIDQF